MKTQIRATNFKIHDHTQAYAQKKLARLERYMPNIREVYLELSFQDNKRGEDFAIAELTLRHDRGALLRTEERTGGKTADSMEAAINAAVEKMHRRIERFLGKRRDKKRRTTAPRYMATEEELELIEEEVPAAEESETLEAIYADYAEEPEVVRRKYLALTPMSAYEAIEQMELLGHPFFMYLDGDTGQVSVMYRRGDGTYGVLLPGEAQSVPNAPTTVQDGAQ